MYFKLWSSSEFPFMSYKRFSPKSPHGANGEGKERVKRLFTIFLDFPFIIVSETVNLFTVEPVECKYSPY